MTFNVLHVLNVLLDTLVAVLIKTDLQSQLLQHNHQRHQKCKLTHRVFSPAVSTRLVELSFMIGDE